MLLRGSSNLLPRHSRYVRSPCAPILHPATGSVRLLARAGGQDKKSWGDILNSAADLAKDVVKKVTDTVGSAIAPSQQPSKPQTPERRQEPPPQQPITPFERSGGMLGSLLGRAVGGLVATAVDQIGKQLEQAAAESQSVYDAAASRVMASSRLRSAMGEVRVGPIISQSSSSMYVNGVSTKSVNLVFPVYGPSGQIAQAQVLSQGSGKSSQVTVQLPNGSLIRIEESGSGRGAWSSTASETIDVEFKEVKK